MFNTSQHGNWQQPGTTPADVKKAREDYLAAHPFDPAKNALMAHNSADGMPAGFLTLPDIGEAQVTAMKLGMEYLAICHDEELVQDWIGTVMGLSGDTETAAVMFAYIFRGMDTVVSMRIGTSNDPRQQQNREMFAKIAANGWAQHFGGDDK